MELKEAIINMPLNARFELFILWQEKIRREGMKTLPILEKLDDIWNAEYEMNRIEKGFTAARCIATRLILSYFFDDKTTKLISGKQGSFEIECFITECCKIGLITNENFCPNCGRKIIR